MKYLKIQGHLGMRDCLNAKLPQGPKQKELNVRSLNNLFKFRKLKMKAVKNLLDYRALISVQCKIGPSQYVLWVFV